MKPTVYIETTIISYLTARPSRDLVRASQQRRTADWWKQTRPNYGLVTSQLTLVEAAAGDSNAAARRLRSLQGLPLLTITDNATALAETLVRTGAFPPVAERDALHVAICATHGVPFLLTWNFKHLASAVMRDKILDECRNAGFPPPVICSPDEL